MLTCPFCQEELTGSINFEIVKKKVNMTLDYMCHSIDCLFKEHTKRGYMIQLFSALIENDEISNLKNILDKLNQLNKNNKNTILEYIYKSYKLNNEHIYVANNELNN
jgi:F0F1-type ATP synthase delta subunit